jgi:hypothetical protein
MMIEDSLSFDQIFDFPDFDVSSSDGELGEMKRIQNLNGNRKKDRRKKVG